MNKFTKKITGKFGVFLPVALIVLVVGIVITAIFGWNVAPAYDNAQTVKISVNSYYSEERVNALQGICKKEFGAANIAEDYVKTEIRTTTNNYAIVYSFPLGDEDKIELACEAIRTKIEEAAADESNTDLYGIGNFISVSSETKVPFVTRSSHFILRACIAGGVALLATFIYVTLRHKLAAGVTATAIALVTLGLTAAITVIARIPVSSTGANALFLSLLFGAVFGTIVAGKMHREETDEENAELSSEELTAKGIPAKTLFLLSAGIALGTLLIGAMGVTPVQWLSLIALIGLICALFTAGILFPAIYPPVLTKLRAHRAAKRRYDYNKKTKTPKNGGKEKAIDETTAAENADNI